MNNVINNQPVPQQVVEQMEEDMANVDCSELAINITIGALVGLTCSIVWGGNVVSHVATGMCAGACATGDGEPRIVRIFGHRFINGRPRPEGELRPEVEPRPEEPRPEEPRPEEPGPEVEPELIGAAFGPDALDVPHDDLRRRGIQP